MIVVNLKNGNDNVSYQGVVELIPIRLLDSEAVDMATALGELAAKDIKCSEWLTISKSSTTQQEVITLNSSSINEEVCIYEKGCLNSISDTCALSNLVDSIIVRKFTANVDFIGWIIIKKLDSTNFLLEIAVDDNSMEQTASMDLSISGTPNADPTSLTLVVTTISNTVKQFSTETLGFDDPVTAVGATYTISIDLKDSEDNIFDSFSLSVTVQDI